MFKVYDLDSKKYLISNDISNCYSLTGNIEDIPNFLNDIITTNKTNLKSIKTDFSIVYLKNDLIYFSRDIFGNIPLYYYTKENTIYYSNYIKEIVESNQYQKSINEHEAFNFLTNIENGYNEFTIWENIFSVIPGHILSINKFGEKSYSNFLTFDGNYWPIGNKNYKKEFLNFFKKSIISKIADNSTNIGGSLSGGIDSSSIISLTQSLYNNKISTVEFRTIFESEDERSFAQSVVDKWDTNHNIISEYPDFYDSEENFTKIVGMPSYGNSIACRDLIINQVIIKNKTKVFLSGQGGDDILQSRALYLNELFETKKYRKLINSLKSLMNIYYGSTTAPLKYNFSKNFLKSKLLHLFKVKKYFSLFKLFILINEKNLQYLIILDYFKRKKLIRNQKLALIKDNNKYFPIKSFNHLESILNENKYFKNYLKDIFTKSTIKYREQQYLFKRNLGFEFKYPFYDFELLNFMISVPKDYNFGNGIARVIIRDSLEGILPDSIRERKTKTYYDSFAFEAFKNLYPRFIKEMRGNKLLWNYVDEINFNKIGDLLYNKKFTDIENNRLYISFLGTHLRVIYFGIWVKNYFK